MKKGMFILTLFLLIIPISLAADLKVTVLEKDNLLIAEDTNPAKYTLLIKNQENITDSFEIFSLVGVTITPKSLFTIPANGEIELEIEAAPHKETREKRRGLFLYEYQIKGKKTGFYKNNLDMKIIELQDVIDVTVSSLSLEDEIVTIALENMEEVAFEDLQVDLRSIFFEFSETLTLEGEEIKTFTAQVIKPSPELTAGEYRVDVAFQLGENTGEKIEKINFLEKGDISAESKSSGLILRKKTTTKTNIGNIDITTTITEKENAISRLFTTFSKEPDLVERRGFLVEYVWQSSLNPGESFSITKSTNYTIPLIVLLLIIAVIIVTRFLLTRDLSLQKRVSLVKTKGGELALKVKIRAKARKPLADVKIADRLPSLAKLYERFGTKPDKIDEKTRQIYWHLNHLNAGEERTFTYIMYSKLNIVGKLELPSARAKYTVGDKTSEVYSNKTSFAAETSEDRED